MAFFLVTYDGPTANDEVELMTAIQMLGPSSKLASQPAKTIATDS